MDFKVSVILPVFNRENLVVRTLESILKQNHRPLELIVVDNNSTDSSFKTIENYFNHLKPEKELTLKLLSESNPGACAARNKGLKDATGDFAIFFDSDDTMRPSLIEEAVAAMSENPSADIVCWPVCIHLLNGATRTPPFSLKNPFDNHVIHALLRPQGYMAKKKIFTDSGGWNENLRGWNDWELGIRILLRQPKIIGIEKVLSDIFSQEDSITGKDFSHKEGVWENALATAFDEINKSDLSEKQRVKSMLHYRKIILGANYHKEGNLKAAKKLYRDVIDTVKPVQRLLLSFAYHYTRLGGRGAWRIIGRLL